MIKENLKNFRIFLSILVFLSLVPNASAQTNISDYPLIQITDLDYQGAFRLSSNDFGASSLNYSEGPLYYSHSRNSIFIVGHTHQQAVAEFVVPTLVRSTDLSALNIVNSPAQEFSEVLGRASAGNPQALDRLGGLIEINGKLYLNAYEYYDAPADNSRSLIRMDNYSELAATGVFGFYQLQGGAGHTSGWISPVPAEFQSELGGTHLTGASSGIPIIGRSSVGPSAFSFNPATIGNDPSGGIVPTTKLLDFSLSEPLHPDLSNAALNNSLWTHLSRATYGFIVPGSRSYLTIGYSGGHSSGVCYKCTQNSGNLCGGYCAPDADDYSSYYWLWDLSDMLKVKNGELEAHLVRPYSFGAFQSPIPVREIGGGSYDPSSGRLFLSLQRADTMQGQFRNPPVIAVFKIGEPLVVKKPKPPTNLRVIKRSR